jgi:hypothetical protein
MLYSLMAVAHHLKKTHKFETQESPECHSSGDRCVSDIVAQEQPITYSAYDAIIQSWHKTGKLLLVKLQQIFDKYTTWVNVLILYTIDSKLLLKQFVILKCYSFNCTTTMTSRDRNRWYKYIPGV